MSGGTGMSGASQDAPVSLGADAEGAGANVSLIGSH